jgi:hypothetical protein
LQRTYVALLLLLLLLLLLGELLLLAALPLMPCDKWPQLLLPPPSF